MGDNNSYNYKSSENVQYKEGPEKKDIQYLKPVVAQKRESNTERILAAVILGLLIVALEFALVYFLKLDVVSAIIVAVILVTIYAIALFFLLESKFFQQVSQPIVQTIEKPVYIEKAVEKTIEKPVYIDRPVEKKVYINQKVKEPVYIRRPLFIEKIKYKYREKKRKKLNIPSYEFTGSDLTRVYHKSSCRLSKSIKRKYRIHSHTEAYFKNRKFRPCESCILKNVKI